MQWPKKVNMWQMDPPPQGHRQKKRNWAAQCCFHPLQRSIEEDVGEAREENVMSLLKRNSKLWGGYNVIPERGLIHV